MVEKINKIFSKNIAAFDDDVTLVKHRFIEYLQEIPKDSFAQTQYLDIEIGDNGVATICEEILFKENASVSKEYTKKVITSAIDGLREALKDTEKDEINKSSEKLDKIEFEEENCGYTITIPALF